MGILVKDLNTFIKHASDIELFFAYLNIGAWKIWKLFVLDLLSTFYAYVRP